MFRLMVSSFADAVAVTVFLLALMADPPPSRPPGAWMRAAAALAVASAALCVELALTHHTFRTLSTGALALASLSACIWLLRAPRTDDGGDDGGGGGGPGNDQPPAGPSDGDLIWRRFVEDFWAYVDARGPAEPTGAPARGRAPAGV